MKAFLDELKRRNVIRVAGIYIVAGWILMQAAALLEDALSMPAWFDTIIVSLILLGFPVVLLFAWLYEVTPEGLRRTPATDTPEDQAFAASTRRRLDRALIAGIVLAVAVVAADRLLPRTTDPASAAATEGAATSATGQATAPTESLRTAFFGFTASGNDPAMQSMADAATDETFNGMGAMRLGTAARAETLNTQPDKRLARARELGAQYALSGEVRRDGDAIGVTMRLEDVPSLVTLWEESSIRGKVSDTASLPVQAAAKATSLVGCLARFRASLPRDEQGLLLLTAKVCSQMRAITVDAVRDMRELARKAPGSAIIQAETASRLATLIASNTALPAARPALLAEAEEALKRAQDLDPALVAVINARANVAVIKSGDPLEQKAILEEGLAKANADDDIFSYASLNFLYGSHLTAVGRSRAAEPYMKEAMSADPYYPAAFARGGRVLAVIGRSLEADKTFDDTLARMPDGFLWAVWMYSALFLDTGDPDRVLDRVGPVNVKPDAVDCWRRMGEALVLNAKNPGKARADGRALVVDCYDGGKVNMALGAISMFAALDDLDRAFAFARNFSITTSAGSGGSQEFFWSPARAMRKDGRFLELVKDRRIWEYWIATGSHPDVCDDPVEKAFEVCAELARAQK